MMYKPESVPLWVADGKCNKEDTVEALRFIENNKLVPKDKLNALIESITDGLSFVAAFTVLKSKGYSDSDIEKMLEGEKDWPA